MIRINEKTQSSHSQNTVIMDEQNRVTRQATNISKQIDIDSLQTLTDENALETQLSGEVVNSLQHFVIIEFEGETSSGTNNVTHPCCDLL